MNKRSWLQTTNAKIGNRPSEVCFTAQIAAWKNEGRRRNHLMVDIQTGEVFVWDTVAAYYTRCHQIAPATLRRVVETAHLLAERL